MAYPKTTDFYRECRSAFQFDESDGKFYKHHWNHDRSVTWLEPTGRTTAFGVYLALDSYQLPAHHLVWRMMTGNWPEHHVKHKNKDVNDNRPFNLYSPGEERSRRKAANKGNAITLFLKSIGVTDRQMKRLAVQRVRDTKGELAALDMELSLNLISKEEHAEEVQRLNDDPLG